MGYSLSWLAVKGKPPELVREELGLVATGARERDPRSKFAALELTNGWYLIVANREEQVAPDGELQRLSSGCETITCYVEEHVMFSSAAAWKDGRRVWSVVHDSEKGIEHLAAEGELPPAFVEIVAALRKQQHEADSRQEDVDCIFDVPVEIAHALVGYRHYQDLPESRGVGFEVLTGPEKKTSSFWKRLFGG